jgi:hypothetical protein
MVPQTVVENRVWRRTECRSAISTQNKLLDNGLQDRRRLTASARPGSLVKSLATKVVRPKNQSNGLDVPLEIATTVSLPNVMVPLFRTCRQRSQGTAGLSSFEKSIHSKLACAVCLDIFRRESGARWYWHLKV